MRILIVNDDGINAPGLAVAEAIAAEVGGPDAEIWVVAPENERSGASHAISYASPMRALEIEPRRWAIDGYPADCAILGLCHLLNETPPDLVLSGVNRGFNLAEDTVYSGTVGAAMEAALQGAQAIALSQAYSRAPDAPADLWAASKTHGAETVRKVMAMPQRPGVFYNVNFPARAAEAVAGTRVCRQGMRAAATFTVAPHTAPSGRHYHFLSHATKNETATPDSDAVSAHNGFITISPLFPQLTVDDLLEEAAAVLEAGPQAAAG